MQRRTSVLLCTSLFLFCLPLVCRSGGTVSTPTEAALNSALSGGGTVIIACDGTITNTSAKTISSSTTIDASGHTITLSGSNAVQLFKVNSGVSLTLINVTLANGRTTTNGGAIYNLGTVVASNCTFTANSAAGTNGANGAMGSGGGTGGDGGVGKPGGNALGGAICNLGSLTLNRCSFQSNSVTGGNGGTGGDGGLGTTKGGNGNQGGLGADAFGGAVYSTNFVAVTNCTFTWNKATGGTGGNGGNGNGSPFIGDEGTGNGGGDGSGAGLYALRSSVVVDCTFSWNIGSGGDAGSAGGTLIVPSGNSGPATGKNGGLGGASLGGGFCNLGTNTIFNCTFFSNSLSGGDGGNGGLGQSTGGDGGNGGKASGAALYSSGSIGVTNCTFSSCEVSGGRGGTAGTGLSSGNSGSAGGSLGDNIANVSGTFTLKNSILAYPIVAAHKNSSGTVIEGGNNISSDNTPTLNAGLGSFPSTDPLLDDLADNSGPTKTCALFFGSPAIDSGSDSAAPLLDQRGYFRYGVSDMGAFEFNGMGMGIRALGQIASLDGNVGLFLFQGPVDGASSPVTVSYTIGGTASNGVDYVQITNSATIPTGEGYAVVPIRGIAGAFSGTNKTVTLTLLSNGPFAINPTLASATVFLYDHSTLDSSKRYVRGSSTASDYQSFVIPVDFERGVVLDAIGGNATNLFPGNIWTNNFYHFDATNTAYQDTITNRFRFQNPIVAFGSPVGGTALYLNQSYSFGIFAGNCLANVSNALRIQVYYRSNAALAGTISLPLPDTSKTNQLTTFVTNGFTVTAEQFGLRTVLLDSPDIRWGVIFGGDYILTHTASASATNYYYVVEQQGFGPYIFTVLDQTNGWAWSKLYAMEFSPVPTGRATFIDAPHFDGAPLPSAYQGRTVQELTNVVATLPDLSALVPSSYLTIDGSPELRRHPILDQFVKDMGNDPLALANYVINEVDLTDTIDYDTNFNSQSTINLGGVDRSALATFEEGQGSPAEQCALLIYLLRQAGVPATYIYPTNGGLQMLDTEVSKLLRVQLRGALSPLNQTNLPQLISLNYPWVAAYVNSNWVQVFPWIKDTEINEGLNLYGYMPTNYNSGFKWMSKFIANDTNILSLSTSDQPLDLLPAFIQNSLNSNYPGISVDDIGVQIVNRRHTYAQWSDFPKPFSLTGTPLIIESLKTNLNIFNTLQIQVYSQANTNKLIDTSEMYVADLHNRKMLLKYVRVDTTNLDMVLVLNSYSTNITSQTNFSATANPTWKLVSTNRLNGTDNNVIFQVTHRRSRFLPSNYAAPGQGGITNLWGYSYFEQGEQQAGKQYQFTDTFVKGDLITFCLDVGRVSQRMLDVHAQEIWRFNQNANTNQPSTLDPDIYAGTTAYLMGMCYFNYVDRFLALDNRLHKFQTMSAYEHGYGILRAQRNGSGQLLNNNVTLFQPAVHMPNNGQALIFNGTLHPDSGRDPDSASLDWWLLLGLQSSAAEHAVLRSYCQTNALSAVKLLQGVGTNIVKLNADNYLAYGETNYHAVKLKNADTNLWNKVLGFFNASDVDRQVWITPGVVTNGTYSGVAALLFSYSSFDSPIGGLDGGISDPYPTNTFGNNNSINVTVNPAPDGSASPFQLMSRTPVNDPSYLVNGATATWSQSSTETELGNNQVHFDPTLTLAGTMLSGMYLSSANSAAIYDTFYNTDLESTQVSSHGEPRTIADPVDAMTGGFYVDATDLTLPGPMPLQIRRNYESQNLAENEFGFGWKINCATFLTVATNSTMIYAAEMDGSFLAYRQTATNANVWLPQPQDNPTLNNNSSLGIGSVANLFNNRIALTTPGGTNVYTLTGGDGSIRILTQRSYPIGGFNRQRPYLDKWQDNRGNYYLFQYGSDSTQTDYGKVRRIQSSNGNFLGFYYDVYGHIVEAYTGDGRRLEYDYDKFGDLLTVTLPDQSEINYQYQHANYVTNSVTNVYSTHLITEELKADGRILKNDYDSLRRVTNQYSTVGVDLSLVRNATFLYTNNFALGSTNLISGTTTILDYTNRPTTYSYTNSLIRKIVDALNQTIVQDWYETNSAGGYQRSLKSRTDKRGLQTAWLYDSFGNVTNVTVTGDLLGDGSTNAAVTSATYNTNNLPLQLTDPATNSIVYVYDTNFIFLPQQAIKYAGATAISTNFMVYESVTNVVTLGTNQVTNTAFGVLRKTIRAYGSLDAATNETFCDGRGFPTNAIQYTGTGDPNVTNQFLYNTRGELVQRTDAAGRSYRFIFDPLGRPTGTETYDTGQSQPMDWTYSYYNENGELTWTDGPRFNPEDYVWRDYDGAGRRTTEIHWRSEAKADGTGVQAPADPNLYATSFSQFDPLGNPIQVTDPLGNTAKADFDALGQMLRQRFYDSTGLGLATNGFAYEPGGEIAFSTNALGGLTSKRYTQRGQLKSQTNPDGSTLAWTYYLDGRIRREIQKNNAYWESTYDDANRKITRIYYSALGSPLATNSTISDRRGNVVQRTDEAFNLFTNLFDGLDRLKIAAGPPEVTIYQNWDLTTYTTNVIQQVTTYIYTNSSKLLTMSNALGEKTVTVFDPINRPLSVQIYSSNSLTPVRVTSTSYSADHQSVTVTNGSGAEAIFSTSFTDNDGRSLLAISYPFSNVREFNLHQYDLAGNLIHDERDSSTNGSVTTWTTANYSYDGLHRMVSQSDRDGALTYFYRDPLGNVTNRVMPGGTLKWQAIYDNAGELLQDWNIGSDGSGTATNTYSYGAGLLQTSVDNNGVTTSYTYDDFLRIFATTNDDHIVWDYPLTTTYQYDARSLLTNVTESTHNVAVSEIHRTYDAYRNLSGENEYVDYSLLWAATQSWDSAGRRTSLGFGEFAYNYTWRPDGMLASASVPGGAASYGYNTAGLLTNRVVGARVTTITSRDGVGRPLALNTTVNTIPKLSEALSYTGDGLLGTHVVGRNESGQFTNSQAYFYANQSRRLSEERLNLDAAKRWTNSMAFDGGTSGGLGVLTQIGQASNAWTATTDVFSRLGAETNTIRRQTAYGRVNGFSTVSALLDGQASPVELAVNGDHNWPYQWRTTLELAPGAHQLSVSAEHPSGMFNTNSSVWFTNTAANEVVSESYDPTGQRSVRIWRSSTGATNRTQTLTWDVKHRLHSVVELDSQNNGYQWFATYDALGRRVWTWYEPEENGTTGGQITTLYQQVYDPSFDFLELGVSLNGLSTWKLCGPDLNGTYGGLNGLGGFDAIIEDPDVFEPVLADARGNLAGYYDPRQGSSAWNSSRPAAYGGVPGYRPLPFGTGGNLAQCAAWHGRWSDITGFIQFGHRYYDPQSGTWLSADPTWNSGDPGYYSFCGGDPINMFDPFGRNGSCIENDPYLQYDSRRTDPTFRAVQNGVWRTEAVFDTVWNGALATFGSGGDTSNPQALEALARTQIEGPLGSPLGRWLGGYPQTQAYTTFTEQLPSELAPAAQDIMMAYGALRTGTYDAAPSRQTAWGAPLNDSSLAYSDLQTGIRGSPSQLVSGRQFEADTLANQGLAGNQQILYPTPEQMQSAAFNVIVGPPKYNGPDDPVGTKFDSMQGGYLEIKGGSSELGTSYQLRLQTYFSAVNSVPYTIQTTRPVNPAFQDYLQRWGATVQRPPPPQIGPRP